MHNGGHHQVNLYYLQLFESDANSVTDYYCLKLSEGLKYNIIVKITLKSKNDVQR